jgi:hypothetical protein
MEKNGKSKDYCEEWGDLSSYIYIGVANGKDYGIKSNCNDGTVMIYMKINKKWQVIDTIDEDLGTNFENQKLIDLNGDKFSDIILIDFDKRRRIAFTFDSKQNIFVHNRKFDIHK